MMDNSIFNIEKALEIRNTVYRVFYPPFWGVYERIAARVLEFAARLTPSLRAAKGDA